MPSADSTAQQNFTYESQRTGREQSSLVNPQNHADAPGYTKLGPPKNLLKPLQPSANYNPVPTLPSLTTENSLDPDIESSGQAVSGHKWEVKPRPRPGRKLATDAPDTKRKQQNREAQRAFRERRAQRVTELEDELKKLKRHHQENIKLIWQNSEEEKKAFTNKWTNEFGSALEVSKESAADELRRKDDDVHQLRDELLRKDSEIQYWKEKAQKAMGMETQITPPPYGPSMGHPFSNSSPSVYPNMNSMGSIQPPSYPRGSFSDNVYGSSNFRSNFSDTFNFRPSLPDPRTGEHVFRASGVAPNQGFGGSTSAGTSESCVNCTGDNCPCVDEFVDDSSSNVVRHPSAANPPISPTDSRIFPAAGSSVDFSGREIDFTGAASGQANEERCEPGECANCKANPDQKRFCQTLNLTAKRADEPSEMTDKDSVLDRMLPPASRSSTGTGRMSCDETYNYLFPNRNFSMDSQYSDFMKDLLAAPSSRKDSGVPGAPQRTALDVECASVLDYMRSSGSVSAPNQLQHPTNSQKTYRRGLQREPGQQDLHDGGEDDT
ncbi:hypothetical protein EV356DRAFT_534705 [Viridothelium virens]|uniref:BZIP domain-containing protein n=1 Tax=Viridothelium virens TaxID=1048519 RepID=A0A6A6H2V1_VIRVR|nr:hypothetical protein EV356DRAFT_534705 [Viridothelium virens]